MSASKNKMTERQRQEAQEAKKLKAYTTTFWIVLALCICIVVTTVLSNPVKNVLYKNTTAITPASNQYSVTNRLRFRPISLMKWAHSRSFAS